MTSPAFRIRYEFHPVGQGLFASGVLSHGEYDSREESDRVRLRWVYDCGTSSSQTLLRKAIHRFANHHAASVDGSKLKLDLVTLSHFDADHINGLVTLLSKFSIRTLLLPYMALWQRLVAAVAEGVDSQQDAMQFFVDPVAYVLDRGGDADIERILFVPGGANDGPSAEGDFVPDPPGDAPWELEIDRGEARGDDQAAEFAMWRQAGAAKGVVVEMMRPGGSLRAGAVWEFVPYNDAELMPKATSAFRNAVARKRAALLAAPSDTTRKAALATLKDLYDRNFGRTGKLRNVISLFLYAGPLGARADARSWWRERGTLDRSTGGYFHHRWRDSGLSVGRCGVLYTGDGYLETKARLDSLRRFLRAYRMKRISCLQVMHHGASGNWQPGLAKKLAPDSSVFSSDPDHRGLGHPHAEVLRDFWPFSPLQAGPQSSVVIRGEVTYF